MAMNTVCHIEFECTNFDRSQSFFEATFGWQFREFGPMRVFASGDDHVGGLFQTDSVTPASFTAIWIQVEDVTATAQKAGSAGGQVVRERYEIPGVGFGAEIKDPDGNPIGLVQFAAA
ncbi:MAG: VOC family protein [Armatimonadetes bacterium]|nr:VOC family protein [Armatimonadota bacterium]